MGRQNYCWYLLRKVKRIHSPQFEWVPSLRTLSRSTSNCSVLSSTAAWVSLGILRGLQIHVIDICEFSTEEWEIQYPCAKPKRKNCSEIISNASPSVFVEVSNLIDHFNVCLESQILRLTLVSSAISHVRHCAVCTRRVPHLLHQALLPMAVARSRVVSCCHPPLRLTYTSFLVELADSMQVMEGPD